MSIDGIALDFDQTEASIACHRLLNGTAEGAIAFIEAKQTLAAIRRLPVSEAERKP
jgi:hypothetical protein